MDSKKLQYGNGLQIDVPESAVRCVVRVRHTHSVQEGENETRTITTEGKELCDAVQDVYAMLMEFLVGLFGPTIIACSTWPRALLTAYLVTRAPHIHQDPRLKLKASVKKSPAPEGSPHPNLYAHWQAEGLSLGQMMQQLAADPKIFGPQNVEPALADNVEFLKTGFGESKLVIAFDHEPMISLLAAKHDAPAELLGLEECQAFVFFLDKYDGVLPVQKFTPPATLASAG